MQNSYNKFDIIIIGCGLSGLITGLHLQDASNKVLIIDKRKEAGGLCGTKFIDNFEFVIGCNEFGSLIANQLETLKVPITFLKPNLLFCFDNSQLQMPLTLKGCFKLLPYTFEIIKLVYLFKYKLSEIELMTLEDFLSQYIKNSKFKELLKILAYPYSTPIKELSLRTIIRDFSKEYNYGLNKSVIPIGGPKILISKMVEKFKSQGGTILLEKECLQIIRNNNNKIIKTQDEEFITKTLVSTQGRWDQYQSNLPKGLSIGVIYLAVKKNLPYPSKTHTLIYLPSDITLWMTELGNGIMPEAFGWHMFKSDLEEKPEHYTVNIYFYCPRNVDTFSKKQKTNIEKFIFTKAENILPGFKDSILYKKFVSPKDFIEIHGLSSRPVNFIMEAEYNKPVNYDSNNDIYYIGNSVLPYGEHAAGAVLSGVRVANIIKGLT